MKADCDLLQLPHVPLQTKDLLPEFSGIYYVLDNTDNVWYIGQAKNICKRWKGKAHHRIDQLEAQKKTQFMIYYELVSKDRLDEVEKQRIEKYHPHLNESPVKTKQVHPTETLLRETLVAISDFALILGVEPPRKEIADQISNPSYGNKKLLSLPIIHISIDRNVLKEKFNPDNREEEGLIKASLNSRKAYASKWEGIGPFLHVYHLYVNGYAIELHWYSYFYSQDETQDIRQYHDVELAGESMKTLTPESLNKMQVISDENRLHNRLFKRINPYDSDLVIPLFNEFVDRDKIKKKISQVSQDYKTGKRGYGSRSKRSGTRTLSHLLQQRGIDPEKYSKEGVFRFLREADKMGLFVKSFAIDLKRGYKEKYRLPCADEAEDNWHERDFYNRAAGFINYQKTEAESCKFETLYLLAKVDQKSWLLVEEYLQDFASVNPFANGVGYVGKFYVSPRKFLVPAKVTIKILELDSGFGISFGPTDDFPTFETAKQEIKRRLQASNLPEMKLTFQREKVTQ